MTGNRGVVLPISTLALLVVLSGVVAQHATAQGWEYGELTSGDNVLRWSAETTFLQVVLSPPESGLDSVKSFINKLGITKIPANLETRGARLFVTNQLGRQGWELV